MISTFSIAPEKVKKSYTSFSVALGDNPVTSTVYAPESGCMAFSRAQRAFRIQNTQSREARRESESSEGKKTKRKLVDKAREHRLCECHVSNWVESQPTFPWFGKKW